MSIVEAIQRLERLDKYLQSESSHVANSTNNKKYEKASNKLATIIGHAQREMILASTEAEASAPSFASSTVPLISFQSKEEFAHLSETLNNRVKQLTVDKEGCDASYAAKQLQSEARALYVKEEKIAQQAEHEQYFATSFQKLLALKQQREPWNGVAEELSQLLSHVKKCRRDNTVSVTDLTRAMDAAYHRLTGGSQEAFDKTTKELHSKESLPLKLLGASLIALGLALAASAIFFAPAIIMASTGLPAIYATTLGAAAASTALTVGGAACFFKHSPRMQLAESMHALEPRDVEVDAYEQSTVSAVS